MSACHGGAVSLENALKPHQITLKALFSPELSGIQISRITWEWPLTTVDRWCNPINQLRGADRTMKPVTSGKKWSERVINALLWQQMSWDENERMVRMRWESFKVFLHMKGTLSHVRLGSAVTGRQMPCRKPWKRACFPPAKPPVNGWVERRVCGHVSAAPIQSFGLFLSQETGNYNWTSPGLSPKPASVRARGTEREHIPQSPELCTYWRKRWPSFAQLFLKVGFIVPPQCTDAFSCLMEPLVRSQRAHALRAAWACVICAHY